MKDYLEIFTDSYQRSLQRAPEGRDFFDEFYDRFIANSPEIAAKFATTDMPLQRRHLERSLDHIVYFSIDRKATDELQRVARIHSRAGQDVAPAMYETWMAALVETAAAFDPEFDDEVETAWRVVLAPGIAYMQTRYRQDG